MAPPRGCSLVVGSTISHYQILSQIGSGGMGVVYEAEDRKLGRRVALKFLSDNLCQDAHALQRFRREAYAASALSHPNICTVFDVDEADGRHFIALELLQGRSLREHVRGASLPLSEILNIGIQVADGLQAAHERGIVHRDISSGNVFLCQRGQVKILDFGLAKLARPRQAAASAANGLTTVASSSDSLTSPGVAVGTVTYMSPEQARGEELDARSDVFSLGAVLYEMATGRVPFGGNTSAVIFDGILNRAPAPARQFNPAAPAELERILDKALEKDRDLRYQTAGELAADLKRLKRDSDSASVAPTPADAAATDEVLPDVRREIVRALLGLIQVMYVVFYILALSKFGEAFSSLLSELDRTQLSLVGVGAMTGLIGLATRLYLLAGVTMDYKALGKKFRLLFPFLLPLDWIWAFCPLLLLNRLGFGIAAAAVVALMYLPFSQRTLMRMAYPYTSGTTGIRSLFGKRGSVH